MANITRERIVSINRKGWNTVAPKFYGGTALPSYGPLAQTEEQLHLLGDLQGKAVLELGCGSGHSLAYLKKEKGAGELWGIDMAEAQIQYAREYLEKQNIPAQLTLASMDEEAGLPAGHFDLVVGIYSLGWTPDLERTLGLVYSYLKPGGAFVFSWEHPLNLSVRYDKEISGYVLQRPYLEEGPLVDYNWRGVEIVLQHRTLSTYINALLQAGFRLEQVIESELNLKAAREKDYAPELWYSVPKARLLPTTLIIKASKPGA
jgi:SAM-dependent methyltransferase